MEPQSAKEGLAVEIRSLFGDQEPFSKINREERNCVAMLYHVLLLGGNLQVFLNAFGWQDEVDWDRYEMAVEWSYLRDLWHHTDDQGLRRQIIERGLDLSEGGGAQGAATIEAFNQFYGATPNASTTVVQSPATWHLAHLNDHIEDNDEFMDACRLKWAFRVKPDLVVTDRERVLCIEAKWESTESAYPSSGSERQIFARRRLPLTHQTTLQRFLLEDLLGFDAYLRFLVRVPDPAADGTITWHQAFERLNFDNVPRFIRQWVAALEPG